LERLWTLKIKSFQTGVRVGQSKATPKQIKDGQEKIIKTSKSKSKNKIHTHTRWGRSAPRPSNLNEVITFLEEPFPVVPINEKVTILPTTVGRWQPFHQLYQFVSIPKHPKAWKGNYLARLETIKKLFHSDVVQAITTLLPHHHERDDHPPSIWSDLTRRQRNKIQ
jgi:hypothetical protein